MHYKLQSIRELILVVGNVIISFVINYDHVGVHAIHTATFCGSHKQRKKYTTEQQPFSSSKIGLAFTNEPQP